VQLPFDPDILEIGKEPAPGFTGAEDPEAVDVLPFIESGDDEPPGIQGVVLSPLGSSLRAARSTLLAC
jgi:hypothetical protein